MDAGVGGLLRATWPVSDETARLQLLQRFYGSLYARRAPADKALQTAQRALLDRESSAHPFYWAGYVVVGTDTTPW